MVIISNERFIILSMLEQGKISCDEAIRLLEAIEDKSETGRGNSHNDTILSETVEKTIAGLGGKIDCISKNLSEKFDSIGNEISSKGVVDTDSISSKLKDIEEEYKEKLEKVLADISKNNSNISSVLFNKLNKPQNSNSPDRFSNCIDDFETYFKNFNLSIPDLGSKMSDILSGVNVKNIINSNTDCKVYKRNLSKNEVMSLNFENINGSISVEGYDGDNIEVKIYTRSTEKSAKELFTLINEKDIYGIKAANYSNDSISVEVSVPHKKIVKLRISSYNGRLSISDIYCNSISINAHDCRVYLSGIWCKLLQAGTENSKIEFSDSTFDKITVKSIDTPVLMYNMNCCNLSLVTSNGRVLIELSEDFNGSGIMDISTKNARIEIDLSQCINIGTNIETINLEGSVDISVPDIIYSINESLKNEEIHIVCETPDFSTSINKMKIKAITSKDFISIR